MPVRVTPHALRTRTCTTLRAAHVDLGDVWVLELHGEADVATLTMLGQELVWALRMNRDQLVVDVTGLRFCDVRSAHLIATARRPGPVYVTGATGSVRRVFDLLDSWARQPQGW